MTLNAARDALVREFPGYVISVSAAAWYFPPETRHVDLTASVNHHGDIIVYETDRKLGRLLEKVRLEMALWKEKQQ